MKKLEITPDIIISCGMAIALILAIALGASNEVTIGIAGGLSGYLGQVVSNEADKKRKDDEGGGQ